jgi:peptidase E
VSCLNLFPIPNVADIAAHLLAQDAVWVGGGNTANLLALWRLHGLDRVLRDCWERGIVLAGVSAGSICWHVSGTADSFGPELRPVTDALEFLPFSNAVHYDSEEQRRPCSTRWWPTAPCRLATPPTTASVCFTAGPTWPRRWPR